MTTTDTESTTTPDAAPSSYCENILAVLNVLARAAPGTLYLDCDTPERAAVKLDADRPLLVLPPLVLDALENAWHVRVVPALLADDGREPVSVGVVYARFRPVTSFNREQGHHVEVDEVQKISTALGTFPPPAFLVDALCEVVAVWPLKVALRDMTHARRVQRRLAEHLGAATETDIEMTPRALMHGPGFVVPPSRKLTADDPSGFISVAGKCKSPGMYAPWVTIFYTTLDSADRAYSLEQIEAALSTTTKPEAERRPTTTKRQERSAAQ